MMTRKRPPRTPEPDGQSAATTAGGQLSLSPRLANFRRLYRWLNLTLLQHAVYPLLFVLTSAPAGKPGDIPMPWYLAKLGPPLAAALLAWLYLRQPVPGAAVQRGFGSTADLPKPELARQLRFLAVGLAIMLSIVRLASIHDASALKLILFGLAEAAAFQLINFGVVRRSFHEDAGGLSHAVILFALSWGLRDLMLAAAGSSEASLPLAFLSGCVLGGIVALVCRVLYRWPGGLLTPALVQFIVVTLIIGFV
jgi:hypothetical protein